MQPAGRWRCALGVVPVPNAATEHSLSPSLWHTHPGTCPDNPQHPSQDPSTRSMPDPGLDGRPGVSEIFLPARKKQQPSTPTALNPGVPSLCAPWFLITILIETHPCRPGGGNPRELEIRCPRPPGTALATCDQDAQVGVVGGVQHTIPQCKYSTPPCWRRYQVPLFVDGRHFNGFHDGQPCRRADGGADMGVETNFR